MSAPGQSILETRRYQMFPVLEPSEIERVRRFGVVRSYAAGKPLAKVGEVGHGLTIILAGKVDVTQHDESGRRAPIVTHGPGAFMGELAQLAGRRALVDAHALEPVEALVIPPDRLRALLIADAELGEQIRRALILRRVGLLQAGAGGPVIIGRADSGDAEAMVAPADALAAIPDELGAAEAAPLLCAGVTTFNALRHSGAMPGDVVAFLGIGGLGHLGVQFANSASAPSRSHAAPTRRCSP